MPELTVRLVEPHEYDTWDEFVASSPQGTLYHTSAWKRVMDAAYTPAARLLLIGCFDRHSLAGGCAALERERFGRLTAVTPLVTPYAGFVLEAPLGEKLSDQVSRESEVLGALADWMARRYPYQSLVNPPHLDDMRPLVRAGYRLVPRFTYHLNIKLPPEEIFARFDGSVRRQIRKAERENFEISDNLEADRAFALFEATFKRQGEDCPVPRNAFMDIITGEHLRDHREIICARAGERLASFLVLLKFQRTLYYAVASTDSEFLPTGVNSLLIWEAVKVFGCREWNILDFVGANIPSIARFKEGFNPKLQMHFQAEYFADPLVRLGKTVYDFLAR